MFTHRVVCVSSLRHAKPVKKKQQHVIGHLKANLGMETFVFSSFRVFLALVFGKLNIYFLCFVQPFLVACSQCDKYLVLFKMIFYFWPY